MFAGRFHVSLKQPPVNVTPATIESTVALPCGPRQLPFAGARRVFAPSHPDSNQMEADAAKTSFLQAVQRPHNVARTYDSGALRAWPTCRTGGKQRTV